MTNPTRSQGPVPIALLAAALLAVSGCVALPPPIVEEPGTLVLPAVSAPIADDQLETSESICGLEGFETVPTLTTNPDVVWDQVHVMTVVPSGESGPAETHPSGFRSCYAHTAEGALLATANLIGQMRDPDIYVETLAYSGTTGSYPGEPLDMQIVGFRLVYYNGNSSVITIAFEVDDGLGGYLQSFALALLWQDGDWRIDTSLQEGWFSLESLDEFVPWSAN